MNFIDHRDGMCSSQLLAKHWRLLPLLITCCALFAQCIQASPDFAKSVTELADEVVVNDQKNEEFAIDSIEPANVNTNPNTEFNELHKSLMDSVAGLSEPTVWKDAVRVPIDVTSDDPNAKYYTRQGYGLIQGQWDIEAHRSFVKALSHDKQCIGAYSGLLMLSKLKHNPSYLVQRKLISVLSSLKDSVQDGEFIYTLQERLYAEVAIALVEGAQEDLKEAIVELVKRYPMDFQAVILKSVILPRAAGGNTIEFKRKYVKRVMELYPLLPISWVYWLNLNKSETNKDYLSKEVVPYSANLVRWDPEMPVWHLMHGKFSHLAGNYSPADSSFNEAIRLYTLWGEKSGIGRDVNTHLWYTLIFKVVNLYRGGDFDSAMKLAKELQAEQVNPMLQSEVRGLYLWEVQSLPARLYLARNEPGDLYRAKEALPNKKLLDAVQEFSAAPMYYTGLFEYIAFKIALSEGKKDLAEDLKSLLAKTNQNFLQTAEKTTNFIDTNYFYRGRYAISVYYNFANAEIEKLDQNIENYESFMAALRESLSKSARMSVLDAHVLEEFDEF